MILLPSQIEEAISKLLRGSNQNWQKKALSLSLKYRTERVNKGASYIQGGDDALAYLALRSPATYAQIYGALTSVKDLNPNWQPTNVLDIGSGPGTAIWASQEVFPSLKEALLLEINGDMVKVGQAIGNSLQTRWNESDLKEAVIDGSESFDLVILANVLNEMDDDTRVKTLKLATQHCKGILVIIEPGTPYGYESVATAANKLHSSGMTLIAPFIGGSFVSSAEAKFIQRIKRPEFQRGIRQTQRKLANASRDHLFPASDWEDEKYYYLAYANFLPEITPVARVIEKPKLFKGYVEVKLLTQDNIKIERIFKKDKLNYKMAKKLKLGDILTSWIV